MRIASVGMILTLAAPAMAQHPSEVADRRIIQVAGTGTALTPPDTAVIDYWVAGEGKTPDEASAALAVKQEAVMRGVSGFLGGQASLTAGNVAVIETRGPECNGPNSGRGQPQLSEGVCTVTGYIATLQGNVRTAAVDKAGTAVGLAGRLGARDARLQAFLLSDKGAAMREATARALVDARSRATAIAEGAGVRLGPVIAVRDQYSGPIIVTGSDISPFAVPPPPPPAPRPVEIDVSPHPIETHAQVSVTYSILP